MVIWTRPNKIIAPNLNMLCNRITTIHKQDSTKRFKVKRSQYGYWEATLRV